MPGQELDLRTMSPYRPLSTDVKTRIEREIGTGQVLHDPGTLQEFGRDSGEICCPPELVVNATSVEQIQALLRLANAFHFPVTPRGLGTGLAGGAVPVYGGVILSLAGMNRIFDIDRENLITVVEPGVLNLDLKNAVHRVGLFYPPDPASLDTCSIGGNAATNAGGPACVKYGTTRDYVLGIEAVLPSGDLITAGVQTRKGVVGYDMLHLLIGSEGTLGVMTKLILKLLPHPQALTTLVAFFPALTDAMTAVKDILTNGHIPCAIEFLDRKCLDVVGDLLPFEEAADAGTFLLVEIDGPVEAITKEIEEIGVICMEQGALHVIMAPDSLKRTKMWDIRRQVALRIEERFPLYIPEDIVVPIGRIADFVACLPEYEAQFGMNIYSFGHAGDGNIHLNITAESPALRPRVDAGIEALLKHVLSMGGTISGEHGIGMAKKQFLSFELSPESIRLQKEIKKIFDPHHILNPGKIFDLEP